jgi:oligopeptidase B
MPLRPAVAVLTLLVVCGLPPGGTLAAQDRQPVAPVAAMVPHADTVNGDILNDEYFWMRDNARARPQVLNWLQTENAYTASMLASTTPLQERLYREMVEHIKETDLSVPEFDRGYFYYFRTVKGQQYRVFCRRRGRLSAPEEILLDENLLAKAHAYSRVALHQVSPDGQLLAYTQDTTGSEWYTVYVKDLRTGQLLPDHIDSVSYGLEWAADNRTLFFTRDNAAHRTEWIFRRRLGDPTETVVDQEPDSLYTLGLGKTKDGTYLLAQSASFTTGEARYLRADHPTDAWQVLVPRREGVEYSADHHGSDFLILTNDHATNFRVLAAPDTAVAKGRWTELVPTSDGTLIEGMDVFERYLVLYERGNGQQQIRVLSPEGGAGYGVAFPELVRAVSGGRNPDYHSRTLRFTYSSPATVYDFDLVRRTRVVRKVTEVPGYDRTRYRTARLWAPAPDGARVPISILYRSPLVKDGRRPMLLYGYGSYGISSDPGFNARVLSLVDRGCVFAIAHVRGGQEMGRVWYDQGRMMQKKNTFTDFIAAAEYLEREHWTSADRMAIRGGSAGGLLMGAVTNLRPDLFRAVIADVPFVDVLHTELDPSLEYTTQEWQQWGNPHIPEQYAYMRSYSPYDNVSAQAYPAMLVTAGLNDPRVNYWEPAKWVARLRAHTTGGNPILLRVDMGSGHGGASGRYDALKVEALRYAFLLNVIGPGEGMVSPH